MKKITTLSILSLFGLVFALSLPALASDQGSVSAIQLQDRNRNGKLDQVVITVQNPDFRTWIVRDASSLKLYYSGTELLSERVYVATAPGANPAMIVLQLDENDTNLPSLTSADGFELEYAQKDMGISDGATELQAIDQTDTDESDTELDTASPVLLSSSPSAGQYGIKRSDALVLNFSETIDESSFAFVSSLNPGSWLTDWSNSGKTVTIQHTSYQIRAVETLTVRTAKDMSGNSLVSGPYPNPFSFRVSSKSNPTIFPDKPDPVSVYTSPVQLSTLLIGTPNILSWYTNQDEVAELRLLYSKDGGVSYITIATLPRSETSYMWYPPNLPGSLILRLEAITSQGVVINIDSVNPLSLALPSSQTPPLVLTGPAVSDVTDTSAKLTMSLDAPPSAISLSCNGVERSEPITIKNGDLPTDISVSLSELDVNVSYSCAFSVTDLFGQKAVMTVPMFIASSAGDTVPPRIVDRPVVSEFDISARTAVVTWSTDELSTAELNYGIFLNYGQRATDTNLSKKHSVTLTDLKPGELHQARITSLDADMNGSVTDDIYFVFLKEGDLIKTKDSSAVYWYKNGNRMVFPNEAIYSSWFSGFADVLTVPSYQLSTIPLGENVKMKADTNLVKITSDPKTYAVEPNGTLRWIPTEFMAVQLYGSAWNTIVRDIDVSLFVDYSIGETLADGETPAGYTPRS